MTSMFTPLEATRLSDQAESLIEELITNGELKVGARLPGERELVNRLGVSRTVVREAIGRLASRGILHVQAGKGTFVTGTASFAFNERWQAWLGGDLEKVSAMLAVREVLEVKGAAWAAERATEEDLKELHASFDEFDRAVKSGLVSDVAQGDKLFHYQLAVCAHNDVLTSFVHSINESIVATRRSMLAAPGGPSKSLDEHRAILMAIEARDPQRASEAMARHIGRVRADLDRMIKEGS
jgi:GntR family transcriptional regulator, transcriptional repressor for pyruvate dehydrogenase complex